jgi:hypothetical protein
MIYCHTFTFIFPKLYNNGEIERIENGKYPNSILFEWSLILFWFSNYLVHKCV